MSKRSRRAGDIRHGRVAAYIVRLTREEATRRAIMQDNDDWGLPSSRDLQYLKVWPWLA